jgi:hypothetical protein
MFYLPSLAIGDAERWLARYGTSRSFDQGFSLFIEDGKQASLPVILERREIRENRRYRVTSQSARIVTDASDLHDFRGKRANESGYKPDSTGGLATQWEEGYRASVRLFAVPICVIGAVLSRQDLRQLATDQALRRSCPKNAYQTIFGTYREVESALKSAQAAKNRADLGTDPTRREQAAARLQSALEAQDRALTVLQHGFQRAAKKLGLDITDRTREGQLDIGTDLRRSGALARVRALGSDLTELAKKGVTRRSNAP